MTVRIPIVEVLRELAAAGHNADIWSVLDDPGGAWSRIPEPRRQLQFARQGVDPRVVPTGEVSAVLRRGRGSGAENVFLRIGTKEENAVSRRLERARDAFLFQHLDAHVAHEKGVVPPLPETVDAGRLFRRGNAAPTRPSIVALLDAAWGTDPYLEARDGAICPSEPVQGEVERYWLEAPFARVSIVRAADGALHYQVTEPPLTPLEGTLMVTLNDRLRDILILEEESSEDRNLILARKVVELMRVHRFKPSRLSTYRLGYYFLRNYLGFGRIDPVMRDPRIEDVSCNGPDMPIYVVHAAHRNLSVNIQFEELELNSFVIKLGQSGGKLLSVAQPLVDASLADGSRIQASLGREVTSHGSAFTIRKFREDPLTCVDLVRLGTHSLESMAFLWLAVELKRSMVVMGATASGKTTTLNSLSQFIPPALKIVTIEDTREIMLQHENWLAAVTREAVGGGGNTEGSVTMYDLLRAALRQRPEYILVGEIRGSEGLTLFQAMSTGHTCFSTMHAGSVESAVYRLENPPIGVPRVMLTSLDFFLLQGQVEHEGKSVRRLLSVTEVNGVDATTRNLRMNEVFRWDGDQDRIVAAGPSGVVEEARTRLGWTRSRVDEELEARRRVLEGLVDAKKRHFRDVADAVRQYYHSAQAGATTLTPSDPSSQARSKPPAR